MNSSLEGIFIEVNLRKKKWLIFGGYNNEKKHIGKYLLDLGRSLDSLIGKYDNLLLVGDFNSETSETCMSEFCDVYNLKNLIKDPICFKNPINPSSIDFLVELTYGVFTWSENTIKLKFAY